jgi:hypothetical protein
MRSSDFILFRFSFHFDGSSATMAKQIASRNQYRIRQPTDSMDGSSVDVEAEQLHSNILSQVLGPFQNCLYGSGLSSCHQLVFGDDDVHEIVENLLLEFPKASKKRTIALQELYTLTDSERQSNRCVSYVVILLLWLLFRLSAAYHRHVRILMLTQHIAIYYSQYWRTQTSCCMHHSLQRDAQFSFLLVFRRIGERSPESLAHCRKFVHPYGKQGRHSVERNGS